MKILITADWHIGYPPRYKDHHLDLMKAIGNLLRYAGDCDMVVMMGDILHMSYRVPNIYLLILDDVFKALSGKKVVVVEGNHDSHSDSLYLLYEKHGVEVISRGNPKMDEGLGFGYIPYLLKDEEAPSWIEDGDLRAIFAHQFITVDGQRLLDIPTDEKILNLPGRDGLMIFSGHYHNPFERGNLRYPGCLVPMTVTESNWSHGFWIWDNETNDTRFCPIRSREWVVFTYEGERSEEELISLLRSSPEGVFYVRSRGEHFPVIRSMAKGYRLILSTLTPQDKVEEEIGRRDEEEGTNLMGMSHEALLDMWLEQKGIRDKARYIDMHKSLEVEG